MESEKHPGLYCRRQRGICYEDDKRDLWLIWKSSDVSWNGGGSLQTGAVEFEIKPVCVYSVKGKTRVNVNVEDESLGMLFIADVFSFEELHSEIEKILITDTLVEDWTYPLIQPKLIEEARCRGFL